MQIYNITSRTSHPAFPGSRGPASWRQQGGKGRAVAHDLPAIIDGRRIDEDPPGPRRQQGIEVGHHAVLPEEGVLATARRVCPPHHLAGSIDAESDALLAAQRT